MARFLMTMTADLRARVAAFQTDHGLRSEAEAVRVLIESALENGIDPTARPEPAAEIRARPPAKADKTAKAKAVLVEAEAKAAHLSKPAAKTDDGYSVQVGYQRPLAGSRLKGARR